MISMDDGSCRRISRVASLASTMPTKWTTERPVMVGRGTRLTLASVTTQRVPSEPTTILARLKGESVRKSSRLYPLTRRMILG